MTEPETTDARLASLPKPRATAQSPQGAPADSKQTKSRPTKKKRVDRRGRVLSTIGAVGGGLTLVAGMSFAAQSAEATPDPVAPAVHYVVVVPQGPNGSATLDPGTRIQIPAPAEAATPTPAPAPAPVTQSSGS